MSRPIRVPARHSDFIDCEPEYFEDEYVLFEDYIATVDKKKRPEDPRTQAEFILNEFHMFEKFRKQEMRKEWREDQRQRAIEAGRRGHLKRSSSPVSIFYYAVNLTS